MVGAQCGLVADCLFGQEIQLGLVMKEKIVVQVSLLADRLEIVLEL